MKIKGNFMREKFSYDKYLDFIEKDELEANKYKNQFIPDRLYKYQPIGSGQMRAKRIQTIKKEQIWASRVKYLNDPFEFKMLYADQKNNNVREFYEDVLNRNEIICLSSKWNDKLMWAHYAESHTGMCIEYAFLHGGKGQVTPVTYVANRQCFDDELKVWLKNKNLALEQMLKQNEINGVQRRQLHSCGKIMYTKDSVWKYEKEYRIVYPLDENSKGMNVPIHRLGMRTSRIVAGINCSEDNKKKLNEISNSLGLGNVYTSRIHPEQYTIDYVR